MFDPGLVHDEVRVAADRRHLLDERASKSPTGLAAADKAKSELSAANARVEENWPILSRNRPPRLADAERRAQADHREEPGPPKTKATRSSPLPVPRPSSRPLPPVRALREQVAALAVKGAEQILRKEVNAGVHADLLNRLKTEL